MELYILSLLASLVYLEFNSFSLKFEGELGQKQTGLGCIILYLTLVKKALSSINLELSVVIALIAVLVSYSCETTQIISATVRPLQEPEEAAWMLPSLYPYSGTK